MSPQVESYLQTVEIWHYVNISTLLLDNALSNTGQYFCAYIIHVYISFKIKQ